MNSKKFLIGTVAGGILFFFLGFLIYAVILDNFFRSHAGSATGVLKTDMQFWPLILGNLALAAFLSFIFLRWARIMTFGEGMRAGVVVGFFMALSFDMVQYDTTNIMDLTAVITDIIAFSVMTGIGGGVIGILMGTGTGHGSASVEAEPEKT